MRSARAVAVTGSAGQVEAACLRDRYRTSVIILSRYAIGIA